MTTTTERRNPELDPRYAKYRESLISKLGSEALADLHLRTEIDAANAQHQREAALRAELAELDARGAQHRAETAKILGDLCAEAERLLAAANAAYAAAEAARCAREQDLRLRVEQRRDEIVQELSRPYAPAYRTFWRVDEAAAEARPN